MNQREKDIAYVKSHLGDAYKQGKKIVTKGYSRYAIVELIDGREVKVSLPNHLAPYKLEPYI